MKLEEILKYKIIYFLKISQKKYFLEKNLIKKKFYNEILYF